MNTGVIKSKVGRCAFLGKFSVLVLTLGLMPLQATAATSNAQFKQFITDLCAGTYGMSPSWDAVSLAQMCFAVQGTVTSTSVSANLGTANASAGVLSRNKKSIRDIEEEKKKSPPKAASADEGGWGILVSPQYGKSNRIETDFENGFDSTLSGLVVGLDYRFSDSFVLGATAGQIKDKAKFFNDAGSLETSNNTVTLYGTWLPSDAIAVDGYLGYGNIKLDTQRFVAFGTFITGVTTGNTTGKQSLAGLSISYQKEFDRTNLSPFINLDYIKTSINGFNETGSTLLEMHYGDRSVSSFSSNLGIRIGSSYSYGWGMLLPTMNLAAVHEFQKKAQLITNELVSTPGTGLLVATDEPDRNYLIAGLGVVAALNSGAQVFLDYEKRTQDRLLTSWAISLGALMEF